MNKYKIGDKVRITEEYQDSDIFVEMFKGDIVTVSIIHSNNTHVKLTKGTGSTWWFRLHCIELVKIKLRGGKR